MKRFSIIATINEQSLIGVKEYGVYNIPWKIKEDMKFFKQLTTSTLSKFQINAIIMGYNTWISLPESYKKNNKRINLILSKKDGYFKSFEDALNYANSINNVHRIFVIGGAHVFKEALKHPLLEKIYLTYVSIIFPDDIYVEQRIYFPLFRADIVILSYRNVIKLVNIVRSYDINQNLSYQFEEYLVSENFSNIYKQTKNNKLVINYVKPNNINITDQYLLLIKDILTNGEEIKTRNGIVKSIFGYQMKFNLKNEYPLPTIRKSYPKIIFEELMWIIRGQTDVKILQEKGIHIWDKNSSKEILEKFNFPYEEGDIGPGYGFQMRHYGAKYFGCKKDYFRIGKDQLEDCINNIKNNPQSRRIIIDLWNCLDIDKMVLPPCHIIYHFEVINGKLNCHLFQRSWDVLLGWNTTTAALFTYLLANFCDLEPGILIHSISDAHIYQNNINVAIQLLERIPRKYPTLKILRKPLRIEDYKYEDLVLENYYPCPAVYVELNP
ncbi:MAG: thymidylate synthase [Nitrososphaerota archaeon]